jgi:hypothetical protein
MEGMRKHYEPQDMATIIEELSGESARAAITVGGAMVEHALEQLLRSRLRRPTNKTEVSYLFTDQGILGTFWEKIWTAYFMKLIGPRARRELDLIRLIRNEVAHNINPVTFETQEIANRCRELSLVSDQGFDQNDLRMRFLVTIHTFSSVLMVKAHEEGFPPEADVLRGIKQYLE